MTHYNSTSYAFSRTEKCNITSTCTMYHLWKNWAARANLELNGKRDAALTVETIRWCVRAVWITRWIAGTRQRKIPANWKRRKNNKVNLKPERKKRLMRWQPYRSDECAPYLQRNRWPAVPPAIRVPVPAAAPVADPPTASAAVP